MHICKNCGSTHTRIDSLKRHYVRNPDCAPQLPGTQIVVREQPESTKLCPPKYDDVKPLSVDQIAHYDTKIHSQAPHMPTMSALAAMNKDQLIAVIYHSQLHFNQRDLAVGVINNISIGSINIAGNNTINVSNNTIDNSVTNNIIDRSSHVTNVTNNVYNVWSPDDGSKCFPNWPNDARATTAADLIDVLNPNTRARDIDYSRINNWSNPKTIIQLAMVSDNKSLYGPLGNGEPLRQIIRDNYINPSKYTTLALLCAKHYFDPDVSDNYSIFIHNEDLRQIAVKLLSGAWEVMIFSMYLGKSLVMMPYGHAEDIYLYMRLSKCWPGERDAILQLRADMENNAYMAKSYDDIYDIIRTRSGPVHNHILALSRDLNMEINCIEY